MHDYSDRANALDVGLNFGLTDQSVPPLLNSTTQSIWWLWIWDYFYLIILSKTGFNTDDYLWQPQVFKQNCTFKMFPDNVISAIDPLNLTLPQRS